MCADVNGYINAVSNACKGFFCRLLLPPTKTNKMDIQEIDKGKVCISKSKKKVDASGLVLEEDDITIIADDLETAYRYYRKVKDD